MFAFVSVCVLISIVCPLFWPLMADAEAMTPEEFQASVRPLSSSDPSEANRAATGAKSTKAQVKYRLCCMSHLTSGFGVLTGVIELA